ncbi:MAG: adenylyl-sulfate kinase [Promethearchaeota archaeon]
MYKKNGFAIWITGLPGSGKSTTANILKDRLEDNGIHVQLLRMDEVRRVVTPTPTYSDQERDIVYAALAYMGKILADNGINVIFDATANRQRYRDKARELIKRFMEAYLKCPLEICIEREMSREELTSAPRDIYKRAMKGDTRTVPGFQTQYEEPKNPEIIVEADKLSPDQCAEEIYIKASEQFKF